MQTHGVALHWLGWYLCLVPAGCALPPPADAIIELDLVGQSTPLPAKGIAADSADSKRRTDLAQAADSANAADSQSPLDIQRLYQSEYQTVNLVRITGQVPSHVHYYSEETVYVLSGSGTLHLRDGDRELRAGDLVVVPRNTVHGFTPGSDQPVVVLSIFSPHMRSEDRVFLEAAATLPAGTVPVGTSAFWRD